MPVVTKLPTRGRSITQYPVAQRSGYPFGETRSGNIGTDHRFTGQRADSYINLYEMGARWYSPVLGRWLSPDSIVPDPTNPQSLNRYSYVINRPLNLTDPSGHCAENDKNYDLCQLIVDRILATYGVILQDDTAFWTWQEAQLVEQTLADIAGKFAIVNNISFSKGQGLVKETWDGVVLSRMHRTNNRFNGEWSWVPPGLNGMLIEVPDASPTNRWWDPAAPQSSKHILAEELGHSWDFRGTNFTKYLGGLNGGRFSAGLVGAVGGDARWCFGLLFCTAYDHGPEPTVDNEPNGHASTSPVEDWGGAFAQYIEPVLWRDPLGPRREGYIKLQIDLLVVR